MTHLKEKLVKESHKKYHFLTELLRVAFFVIIRGD